MTAARVFLAVLVALAVAGCASIMPAPVGDSRTPTRIEPARPGAAAPSGKLHTVKKGDTLFSIARENGVAPRDLAAWNNIDDPSRIAVGRQLRLTPPSGAEPAPAATVAMATEVRPIGGMDAVVARPLEDSAAVSPAPTLAESNTERVKREPKGGKLPYSEENLALLKGREAAPAQVAPAPAVPTVVPPTAEKPAPSADAGGIDWSWPASGKLLATFSDAAGQEMSKGIDIAGAIGGPVQAAAAGKVIYVGVFPKHGNLVVVLHAGGYSSVYAHNSRILVKEGQSVARGQKIAEIGDSDAEQPKLHFEVRHQGKPLDPLGFLPRR